jgi:protein-tyrosine kinase
MNTPVRKLSTAIPNPPEDRSFGCILQELGKLQAADTERVLQLQVARGLRFGEAARELGLITEADIQQVMARQFGYRYLQPGEERFSSELVAGFEPFSAQTEMLRTVRAQLVQRWFGTGRKALAVTSLEPADRASLLAANLAVVFAQLGKRTLLVDANLRHPGQQAIFHLNGRKGLSDVLVGRADAEAIVNIAAFDALFVLPAGTLPPNPQELLSRDRFVQVHDKLVSQFDVVLFDVPSFSVAPDALAVAGRSGGALVAARKDASRLADLRVMREQLVQAGAAIVGSVVVDF